MRNDAERFVQVFRLASLQAGAVARRLQGNVCLQFKNGESSPESSALTAVDLAAQDMILHLLHRNFPEAAVDAEEETETVSLFPPARAGRPLMVIDPIDGTLNYSRGSENYAVMGAWLSRGRYLASVIYFPAKEEMYWAIRGKGCWRVKEDGKEGRVRPARPPNSVLVTPGFPRDWTKRLRRSGFEIEVSRCSAVDASIGATGGSAAALSRGLPDRRRAIGFLLTLEAGGAVSLGGRPWRGEDPLSFPGPVAAAVAGRTSTVARISSLLRSFAPTDSDTALNISGPSPPR